MTNPYSDISLHLQGDLVSGEVHQAEITPDEVQAALQKVEELAPEFRRLQEAGLIPQINLAFGMAERAMTTVAVLVTSGVAEVKAVGSRQAVLKYIRKNHRDFHQNPGEDVWVCCYDYIRVQEIRPLSE